jgi:hypothetical protein
VEDPNFFRKHRKLLVLVFSLFILLIGYTLLIIWRAQTLPPPEATEALSPPTGTPAPVIARLENVAYSVGSSNVSGEVIAEDASMYQVMVFIKTHDEYLPQPSGESAAGAVTGEGAFSIPVSLPEARTPGYFCVLLMASDYDYEAAKALAFDRNMKAWEIAREDAIDEVWDMPTA